MLKLLKENTDTKSHEQHFVERYDQLLAWALHLSDHERAQAEDLLHDAFIQFTLARPDLNEIRNIDNYLFGVLRILRISQLRRSSRSRLQQLSIVEYDSAEIGLRMIDRVIDPRELIKVHDELRAICYYACARKESSKAGSVLILRFFHGYYPSEIASVLQSTRKVVDMRLQSARREARLYCTSPQRLSFINACPEEIALRERASPMASRTANDLLQELRGEIFRSRQGDCFSRDELQRMYQGDDAGSIDGHQLSHIVSCPECLDLVNQILGLPSLAERHPADTLGTDKRGPNGKHGGPDDNSQSGGSGANIHTIKQQSLRRAREVFEHRPHELHIAVNGVILGSQKIHAELNEQALELRPPDLAESASFIEVFSEQGLRLLMMPVEPSPPSGPLEQNARVELSDGRELFINLYFRVPHPTLKAVYRDPLMRTEEVSEREAPNVLNAVSAPVAEDRPEFRVNVEELNSSKIETGDWIQPTQSAFDRISRWVRTMAGQLHPQNQVAAFLSQRPELVAVALGSILIFITLFALLRFPIEKPVTAAELLQKSIAAESQMATARDQVLHRAFSFEERDHPSGRILTSRRIEVWQSADHGITARRMFDEENRLIAGEWKHNDGSSKIYFRDESTQAKQDPAARRKLSSDEAAERHMIWRSALVMRDFSALVKQARATVEKRSNVYVLSYQLPGDGVTTEGGRLLKATLILNEGDLRAVEQTLLMRADNRSQQLREYRFVESKFEQLPISAVSPEVFQLDPELTGSNPGMMEISTLASMPKTAEILAGGPGQLNAAGLAALEVEVRYLLDQVNANLGEQISIIRTTDGKLQVRALVETNKRKEELLSALSPLSTNKAVVLDVLTYAEAVQRHPQQQATGPVTVSEPEITQNQIPVGADLRRYFSAQAARQNQLIAGKSGEAWIEEQIAEFANRMQSQAMKPLRHARALKNLVDQISKQEMESLNPETKAKWRKMIQTHAIAIQRDTEKLRLELQPIFFTGPPVDAELSGSESADLNQTIERLVELTSAHDGIISQAFSKSSGNSSGAQLKTKQFWQSLRRAEKLAEAIIELR